MPSWHIKLDNKVDIIIKDVRYCIPFFLEYNEKRNYTQEMKDIFLIDNNASLLT